MISFLYIVRKGYPFLLVAISLLLLWLLRQEQQKAQDYQSVYRSQQQEVEIWRDEAGKNHTRAEVAEVRAANANLVLKEELKQMLRKEVGNIRRNLISYSSVKASTVGRVAISSVDTIYVIDEMETIPARKFSIQNPDLAFDGIYVPRLDTLIADYQVKHNFDIFYHYRRPGKPPFNIFRRKRAVAEIKFENEGSRADSLFTVVMERQRGLLGRLLNR